ncbi:uncharacterized protein LOC111699712 [Eurytemora carolleeae]|uniref:uncharacterized protein LOC111699712 n=1 Tax=Eurytemora carolleeae TaxID=1294199 RepID=UPI000C75E076|nr:uncharacterized protein LOC111699712 [Eurytemora carolleeae]|eukprot:XP_023326206.1 uncharacterized protein LOC111699712 [Eurytemora affinis]
MPVLQQSPKSVFLVRPSHFCFNQQTAITNHFQNASATHGDWKNLALVEFDNLIQKLQDAGILVTFFNDTESPIKPDSIFPNNWISCHETGEIILYPMLTPNRREERRMDIVSNLQDKYGYSRILDLSHYEKENMFLEGTGSVVFDHKNRIAFACTSERTHETVLNDLCQFINYNKCIFSAKDEQGRAVYHTNVVLSICSEFVLVSQEALDNNPEFRQVLLQTNRKVISLFNKQIKNFAANSLEVLNQDGHRKLIISTRGWGSLTLEQQNIILASCGVITSNVETIETVGGGGIRCMLTGLY